jgi:hypothetical protein
VWICLFPIELQKGISCNVANMIVSAMISLFQKSAVFQKVHIFTEVLDFSYAVNSTFPDKL